MLRCLAPVLLPVLSLLAACQSASWGGVPATEAASPEATRSRSAGSMDMVRLGYGDDGLVARDFDSEAPQESPEPSGSDTGDRRLIYTGQLRLAVSDFERTSDRARALNTEIGGYLQSLTDTTLTLRIPSERWDEAIERFEELGDVVGRRFQVQDVTEELTDLEIQLTNARALRQRLEELLAKAENVEAALKIETELSRVRTQIERLEGRMRYLDNRVSYGTLEIEMVRVAAAGRTGAGLPFVWLHELGVVDLLGLEGSER